jgi:diguanylate cyclase (GGDEF)-like protein
MEIALIISALLIAAAAVLLIRINKRYKKETAALKAALEKANSETDRIKTLREYEYKQLVEAVSACAEGGENPSGVILIKKDGERSYLNKYVTELLDWPSRLIGFNTKYDEILSLIRAITPDLGSGTQRIALNKGSSTVWVELSKHWQGDMLLARAQNITASIEAEERDRYALNYDILTGFYKHEAFIQKLKELFSNQENLGIACMVLFEMESLKIINDNYGLRYVDEYISSFAKRLKSLYPQNSIFSRYSSGEFYGFIYGYQDEDKLRHSIKMLISEFSKTVVRKGEYDRELSVKISAGLSWYPKDSTDPNELLNYSNFTVYVKTGSAEDRIEEFSKQRYLKEGYLLNSREVFLHMLENRLVRYAFQVIVDVNTAKVYGYEMLMRPTMPELANPTDVLNLAKIHSKLHVIENITWFEAMKAYVEQVEKGTIPYNTKVFINSVGGVVLSNNELNEFYERFYDYVKNLVIEITETEQNDELSSKKKRQIADDWKAMLALDDYGTGYNGEVALLLFQPNIIKVDINIVHGVDRDSDRLNLLKNIIQYARQRNIRVLAEGVGSRDELKTVIECGVDFVQGHYLATPVLTPKGIPAKLIKEIGEFKHGV